MKNDCKSTAILQKIAKEKMYPRLLPACHYAMACREKHLGILSHEFVQKRNLFIRNELRIIIIISDV